VLNGDPRDANELASAERRFGECPVCGYVADLDKASREIFCPAEANVHPDRPFRRPLPPTSPGAPVRFGDASADARVEFLKAAREEFPNRKPTGVLWQCGCGNSIDLEEVLIANGKPSCPYCGASGWESVFPPPRKT
jgi:hypothetical protein